jgi:integrin-linked kinase-associated serine/threonine phosphatase 2C
MEWLKSKLTTNGKSDISAKTGKNGDMYSLREIRFGSHSIQGEGPKKNECQDTLTIILAPIPMSTQNPGKGNALIDNDKSKEVQKFYYHAFGVLDGHGSSGKEASNSAADSLQKYFEKYKSKIISLSSFKERERFLSQAFNETEKQLKNSGIDYSTSGTCCAFIFVKDNIVTVANLGDSRAVLCRIGKEKAAIELTWDQKPSRKDEKERIISKGGKIERLNYNGEYVGPLRVWADEEGPGIAMTRTLGDFQAKKIGLISEPEIDHLWLKSRDQFIVVASDGVWDVMTSAEVVGFILKHKDDWINQDDVANKLCTEARRRWESSIEKKNFSNKIGDFPTARNGVDDITCVIAFLDFETTTDKRDGILKSEI